MRRILLVEAHPRLRAVLAKAFSNCGMEVVAVRDATEGEEAIAQNSHFDALVVDNDAQRGSEIDVASRLREAFGRTPPPLVLLHRANVLQENGVSNEPYRLVKPFLPRDGVAMLHRAWFGGEHVQVQASEPAPSLKSRNSTILLVEDVAMNRTLVRKVLQNVMPDVHLVSCTNGLEAVEWCTNHHADLILMDVQMPVMDGVEATQRILELPAFTHTPIIALTAGVVQEERDRCKAAGMVDFLPKPFEQATFKNVVERYLHASASEEHVSLGKAEFSSLVDILGGDEDFAFSLLRDALVALEAGYRALNLTNWGELPALAHELKGMAANVRLSEMAACWAEVEEYVSKSSTPNLALRMRMGEELARLQASIPQSIHEGL